LKNLAAYKTFYKEAIMKKLFLLLLIAGFILTSSAVYAAEKLPLGEGNIAVKLDWIKFTDDDLKDVDVDSAFYIGLEGYGLIADDNFYLGVEAGYTNPSGDFTDPIAGSTGTRLTYVPIEVNLKYAVSASQNVAFDIGAGLSYNYARFKIYGESASDWMFGGQFFADLNFTIQQFFMGVSGKYQTGQHFKKDEKEFSCNNFRLGGQIGVMF
jgi:hypothetical protein